VHSDEVRRGPLDCRYHSMAAAQACQQWCQTWSAGGVCRVDPLSRGKSIALAFIPKFAFCCPGTAHARARQAGACCVAQRAATCSCSHGPSREQQGLRRHQAKQLLPFGTRRRLPGWIYITCIIACTGSVLSAAPGWLMVRHACSHMQVACQQTPSQAEAAAGLVLRATPSTQSSTVVVYCVLFWVCVLQQLICCSINARARLWCHGWLTRRGMDRTHAGMGF